MIRRVSRKKFASSDTGKFFMIQCQQCGQVNASESNFCRGCGMRLTTPAPPPPPSFSHQPPPPSFPPQHSETNYEYAPPRPYSWKTDEFQTQADARKTKSPNRVQPLLNQTQFQSQNQNNAPLAYRHPGQIAAGYHCPNCGTNILPIFERRVSTAGWVVFSLLLVFTWIFFWIGLLMKEDVSICPVCRKKVS